MLRLPKLSGEEVIKILVKKFGFKVSRQRGNHVVLVKYENNKKVVTVVPLHKELKKLAGISKEEFIEVCEKSC